MKNSLESIAIMIVAILSMVILSFIVWYNLLETDVDYRLPEIQGTEKVVKVSKEKAYLDNMENYGDDDEEEEEENLDDLDDDINSVNISDEEVETLDEVSAQLESIVKD